MSVGAWIRGVAGCLHALPSTGWPAGRGPAKLTRSVFAALRHPEPNLDPVPSPEPQPSQQLSEANAGAGAGLDAEKLEVLNRWGAGLQTDARAEVAAAGRAILLLVEEIERLHVLLWGKRLASGEDEARSDGER
jgi:hypothetical protein